MNTTASTSTSQPQLKRCSRCRQPKPLSAFGNNKTRHDGLMPECKKCRKEINEDYAKRNKEKNLWKGPAPGGIIPIQTEKIGTGKVNTVNARELHDFLIVGRDFSNWIKDRISQYNFEENQDFVIIAKTGDNSQTTCSPKLASKKHGGHNAKEYHLTHLCSLN